MRARRIVVLVAVTCVTCTAACAEPDDAGSGRDPHAAKDTSTTAGTSATSPPADPRALALLDAACTGELTTGAVGVLSPELTSVSGLAASRRHEGIVWAVEDSLEPPVLVALDRDGGVVATVRVGGPLANLDWEALAVGPGPDGEPWIHIGDIGDNFGIRTSVRVHRFPEPDLDDSGIVPDTVVAAYSDVRPNAEALLVDASGTWVVDKRPDGPATIHHLDADGVLRPAGTVELPGEQVTAADLSADGRVLAVRTDARLHLFEVPVDGGVPAALSGTPCSVVVPDEPQGESVAFLADGSGVLTVSEDESGRPVTLHLTAR